MNEDVIPADANFHLSAVVAGAGAEGSAEITVARRAMVGKPPRVARVPGDWGWCGSYNKSIWAPRTDGQAREEGWPV